MSDLALVYRRVELYQPAPAFSPLGSVASTRTESQRRGDTQAEGQRHWYATPDWWVAAGTIGLFFATTALWFYTYRMWRTTKAAVEDEGRAINAALDQVKESARAADEMANVATATGILGTATSETAQRQLRAYLGIDATPSEGAVAKISVDVVGHSISANIFLKNDGQTPAYSVRDWMNIAIDTWPTPGPLLPPDDLSTRYRGRSIINPGRGTTLTSHRMHCPISPVDASMLRSQHKAIYVYGEIDYIDAFEKARFVRYRLAVLGDNVESTNFRVCDEGNEAD